MFSILHFFWQMCLLKTSPAQVPRSSFATGFIIATFIVIGVLSTLLTRSDNTVVNVIGPLLITLGITAMVTGLLLHFHNASSSFRQTWSATLAISCVMGVIMLPANMLRLHTENEMLITFANTFSLICFGWTLTIIGHIYRKSAGISILQGIALALITYMFDIILYVQLFQPQLASAQ